MLRTHTIQDAQADTQTGHSTHHGDDFTAGLTGKRRSFLIENEVWWRAVGLVSVGSNVRVSRNVYATDGRLLVYPTAGVRYLF